VAGRDTVRGEPLIGHMGGPYAGGNGAQPRRDGIDCSDHGATNGSMVTIEDSESRLPLRFRKLELWTDSGGAGRFRGGLGYEAEIEWLGGEITATLRRERMKFPPPGLDGGGDAPLCRTTLESPPAPARELPGKIDFPMRAGDIVRYWTTGGAGRGSPRERERARVVDDVLDGRVSPEAARTVYGIDMQEDGR
jgi:N-methylhydantoinase B